MQLAKTVSNKLVKLLASNGFFYFIIALFIFQAAWMALSFVYPMIYDEFYHFGIIQYFSGQLSPFIAEQNPALDIYGSLERNPYLLYHYASSFVFRIISIFTDNLSHLVISLRFFNIFLFSAGLVLYRKLFLEMKIRRSLINIALLFFVLLPATPFVAATINYDNLLFLLISLLLLYGVKIINSQNIEWTKVGIFLLVGMTGVLVKSAMIPVVSTAFIYIFIKLLQKENLVSRKLIKNALSSKRSFSNWILIVAIIIIGMFITERFLFNIVQYKSLSPSCTKVISEERCLENSLQLREKTLIENRTGIPEQHPEYVATWVSKSLQTLLWTGSTIRGTENTVFADPLPIIFITVFWGAVFCILAIANGFKKLMKIPGFIMILSVTLVYVSLLFYVNITAYNRFYEPVSVQGRYLLPIIPSIFVFALVSINNILKKRTLAKVILLLTVIYFYSNGAGITTHILKSKSSWYWENEISQNINEEGKDLLEPHLKIDWYEEDDPN